MTPQITSNFEVIRRERFWRPHPTRLRTWLGLLRRLPRLPGVRPRRRGGLSTDAQLRQLAAEVHSGASGLWGSGRDVLCFGGVGRLADLGRNYEELQLHGNCFAAAAAHGNSMGERIPHELDLYGFVICLG